MSNPTGHSRPDAPTSTATAKVVPTMAILVALPLVVSDGYDLIVFGTVQTSLIETTGWGLTNASIGTLGSLAFVGMMIGALAGGRLGDRFGQKRTVIVCTILFTCLNALCGAVDSPILFGILRFLAGVGLGGLPPSSNALVAGLVAPRWRATVATIMMSGVPVGGVLATLTGLIVIPTLGWRWMFFLTLISLLIIPFALKYLPTRGQEEGRLESARKETSTLFTGGYAMISVLFAVSALAVLFVWFGLGTWLPRLLETQGYDLGSALTFTLSLNLGAVIGSILTAWAGTRFGALAAASVATALTGIAMVIMISDQLPTLVTYLLRRRRHRHPRVALPHHRRDQQHLPRGDPRNRPRMGSRGGPPRRRARPADRRSAHRHCRRCRRGLFGLRRGALFAACVMVILIVVIRRAAAPTVAANADDRTSAAPAASQP
ncbi:MFS transporter [Brevibacterium casei]|nr:MFS transporter [Brevibacterium casei]